MFFYIADLTTKSTHKVQVQGRALGGRCIVTNARGDLRVVDERDLCPTRYAAREQLRDWMRLERLAYRQWLAEQRRERRAEALQALARMEGTEPCSTRQQGVAPS